MTWKVGQQVFVVYNGNYLSQKPRWETIEKIGRKWATISSGNRFDIKSGSLDGGNFVSPGRVWTTEMAWLENKELDADWRKLREKLSRAYTLPPHITRADIARIMDILDQKEPA